MPASRPDGAPSPPPPIADASILPHFPASTSSAPAKRSAPLTTTSTTKPKPKRARISIDSSETQQVTRLSSEYKLPLKDADVYYVPSFIPAEEADRWYEELLGIEGWYQPTLKMYGKEITQSRKICAYATEPGLTVKYSGSTVQMQYDYPPLLRQIQDKVEQELGVKFNHVMMNLYEDGKVYIGNHRDNKENRVIASLSLGAPRTFIMTYAPLASALKSSTSSASPSSAPPPFAALAPSDPSAALPTDADAAKEPKAGAEPEEGDVEQLTKKKWSLANGSLVVQQGRTQDFYKHEIPKELRVKEGRISLTFRQLVW